LQHPVHFGTSLENIREKVIIARVQAEVYPELKEQIARALESANCHENQSSDSSEEGPCPMPEEYLRKSQ